MKRIFAVFLTFLLLLGSMSTVSGRVAQTNILLKEHPHYNADLSDVSTVTVHFTEPIIAFDSDESFHSTETLEMIRQNDGFFKSKDFANYVSDKIDYFEIDGIKHWVKCFHDPYQVVKGVEAGGSINYKVVQILQRHSLTAKHVKNELEKEARFYGERDGTSNFYSTGDPSDFALELTDDRFELSKLEREIDCAFVDVTDALIQSKTNAKVFNYPTFPIETDEEFRLYTTPIEYKVDVIGHEGVVSWQLNNVTNSEPDYRDVFLKRSNVALDEVVFKDGYEFDGMVVTNDDKSKPLDTSAYTIMSICKDHTF